MDLFHDLLFPLFGTLALYHWISTKHREWSKSLRAYRSPELSKQPHADPEVKRVTDSRLGRLGQGSIWCDHPGARCTCMTCRWNRKYGEPKPVVAPPAPIYASGPSHPVKPLVAPPPPTNCKLCFRTRPGPVICSREEFDEHQRHA